ncbi:hypothetical protein GCM10018954_037360 [Kutzneria kofuensis]
MFADGHTIPKALRPTAVVLARLDDRFRPALLSTHRSPDHHLPFAAVWPADRLEQAEATCN